MIYISCSEHGLLFFQKTNIFSSSSLIPDYEFIYLFRIFSLALQMCITPCNHIILLQDYFIEHEPKWAGDYIIFFYRSCLIQTSYKQQGSGRLGSTYWRTRSLFLGCVCVWFYAWSFVCLIRVLLCSNHAVGYFVNSHYFSLNLLFIQCIPLSSWRRNMAILLFWFTVWY